MRSHELKEKLNIICRAEPLLDSDVPAYEFGAAVYDGDDILVSLSGWSLPAEAKYGRAAIEELCDDESVDLISAYEAVALSERYEKSRPVGVIRDVKCGANGHEMYNSLFPLIVEKIPYGEGTICALLSVKDEYRDIMRYMSYGWKCKRSNRSTWVAIRW